MSSTLEEKIIKIEDCLKKGTINSELIKDVLDEYENKGKTIRELLEWAVEQKRDDKEIIKYYYRMAGYRVSKLVDELRNLGYGLSNDKEIKETFTDQGYKLLEQIRRGKRDIVFYSLLRIFVSKKKEMPLNLIEAFKSVYSDEMFKIFLFSFLSGILKEEDKQKEVRNE